MEEVLEDLTTKLCEDEMNDDYNCVDCPEFDSCQMTLFDSYDEFEDNDDSGRGESGLSLR